MARALLPLVALASLAACDEATPPGGTNPAARALFDDVHDDDYVHWVSAATEGSSPHGPWSLVFLDPRMEAALAGPTIEAWPDGVTIVCEGRADPEADAELVMIMRKREGAWLWGQYEAAGTPLVYGTATGCVHCHAAGQDFLRSVKLP